MTPSPPIDSTVAAPVAAAERIDVLDVLRGIALFGMFLVHFVHYSNDATTAFGRGLGQATGWFFANRFMTMFAILFGVGFVVQLSRAEARGDRFTGRFVRRLAALAVFGIIVEGFFGFSVLLGYAIWGLPLLLVRTWSTRTLVVTMLACLMSTSIYRAGRAAYDVASGGVDKYRNDAGLCAAFGLPFVVLPSFDTTQLCREEQARRAALNTQLRPVKTDDYLALVRARFTRLWHTYAHPWPMTFLPTGSFVLFLIGVLGFRIGAFQRPREHQRLIVGMMCFGVVSSVISTWYLYPYLYTSAISAPLVAQVAVGFVALPLVRDLWFAFVYIGAILLLAAHAPAWLQRLRPFGIAGRMALTNYILQVAIIDLTFSPHGLGMSMAKELAPLAALTLFAVDVALSSWWLARFRYGPLEWIWRSVTYWKPQPTRLATVARYAT